MSEEKKTIIGVTGMWTKESKNGKAYMASAKVSEEMLAVLKGALNEFGLGCRFMLFENTDKKSDNSPEYSLCVAAPIEKKED